MVGVVAISLDIRGLAIIDDSSSRSTAFTTILAVDYYRGVGLAGSVTISSDNDILSTVDDGSCITSMSRKGQTESRNAESDDEDRFEVHG